MHVWAGCRKNTREPHTTRNHLPQVKSTSEQWLYINVQRFRSGIVFKAHRHFYHLTLGLEVIKQKQRSGFLSKYWERQNHGALVLTLSVRHLLIRISFAITYDVSTWFQSELLHVYFNITGKIVLCSEFPWTKFINYECFEMGLMSRRCLSAAPPAGRNI